MIEYDKNKSRREAWATTAMVVLLFVIIVELVAFSCWTLWGIKT